MAKKTEFPARLGRTTNLDYRTRTIKIGFGTGSGIGNSGVPGAITQTKNFNLEPILEYDSETRELGPNETSLKSCPGSHGLKPRRRASKAFNRTSKAEGSVAGTYVRNGQSRNALLIVYSRET
ncbi:hypothetical protein ACH5RR_041140 [Cinchona calisaya]|uniref:Uncharacterized protein n=1 Tax=Cinchona calisaya TaxID=153742 RepID=A0ABD2XY53_9GENT